MEQVRSDKVGEMGQEWIDGQVQGRLDSDELAGLLNDSWMTGVWQEDGLIHLYWPQERWTSETRVELTALVQRLGADAASMTIHSLPDADWNAACVRNCPRPQTGVRNGIMRRRNCFWNGWKLRFVGAERVLDVGTGRGILAMVALKMGAASAWGIDHDPVAIDCARR